MNLLVVVGSVCYCLINKACGHMLNNFYLDGEPLLCTFCRGYRLPEAVLAKAMDQKTYLVQIRNRPGSRHLLLHKCQNSLLTSSRDPMTSASRR